MYIWIHTLVWPYLCETFIYVWLKLWWIYVRPYLCETWLIAMHVWKFLDYIMYCYVPYLLNISSNMYYYVYYILQICPTVMCGFICLILLQIYNNQTKLYNIFLRQGQNDFFTRDLTSSNDKNEWKTIEEINVRFRGIQGS